MKILVLGASGMIGSVMLRTLASEAELNIVGSVRNAIHAEQFSGTKAKLVFGADLANVDHIARLFREVKPDVVVNCAGLTKHLPSGNDPISALTMNALMPHRLAELCEITSSRLIHISTDCVFSGNKGNYCEDDQPDATDIYGQTKYLGEVSGPGLVTLRTSTIGHEWKSQLGLLEWFLAQKQCMGYRKAIFSGLPTLEFAKVVRDFVIPNTSLEGLYHVGGDPIDKDSLLHLISKVYGKRIEIEADDSVVIDRSLNSRRFKSATGYSAPNWSNLIESMYHNHI